MKPVGRWSVLSFAFIAALLLFSCRAFADDQQNLFGAIESGNNDALAAVLDRGVSPELRAQNNATPLMFAAVKNNVEAARILLDRGAEVDAKGFSSQDGDANSTALILAAEMGSVAVAELLIEKGADVNYVNSFGRTALFWAYKANKTDMVKLLESKGATKDGKPAAGEPSDSPQAVPAPEKPEPAKAPAPEPAAAKPSPAPAPAQAGFAGAAAAARLKACCSNMKVVEGACELYLMENSAPKAALTVGELVSKKYIKVEPRCPLDNASSYTIEMKGYETVVRCRAHGMTLPESIKAVEAAGSGGQAPRHSVKPAPPADNAKKLASLKFFTEVFNKCCHDASVAIRATSNETSPPTKIIQYNYYRDPSNFRSDTVGAGQKITLVISAGGSWVYSENEKKLEEIPSSKAAEISSTMDLGGLISRNIDSFDVTESKDKSGNVLIYITNKKTGVMNTYVIDPKLNVLKRVCIYPKKGFLGTDSVYGAWKFGKIDDRMFAAPKHAKAGAAK